MKRRTNDFFFISCLSGKWSFLILIIFLLTPIFRIKAQFSHQKVGFLFPRKTKNAETTAAYDYLASLSFSSAKITFDEIRTNDNELNEFDMLWFHRPDSTDFSEKEINRETLNNIYHYIENGGSLLLTLEAFKYLLNLGVEKVKPQIRYAEAIDQGYGRKLGLHSYRKHSIFEGLHGGANIFNPSKDRVCRQVGYFDESRPLNGKVVAVDWAYITLKENSKLVVEYNVGKGKIIAIGAYTYFEPENYNRAHLELFISNTIHYLTGSLPASKNYYWDYSPAEIIPIDKSQLSNKRLGKLNGTTVWGKNYESLTLSANFASDNFWDVAGQRMLIMGKEKGGIEEIWAHPFMALRDYEIGVQFSDRDTTYWLNNERPQIQIRPESFTRVYKFRRAYLTEIITTSITEPVGIVHYEYRGVYPAKLTIKFKSNFRNMWPYSERVQGSIYYAWDDGLNAAVLKNQSEDFVFVVGSNKIPYQNLLGQYGNFTRTDSLFKGERTENFFASTLLQYKLEMNDNMDIVLCASDEGFNKTIEVYKSSAGNPERIYNEATIYMHEFLNNSTMITSPSSDFNEGYRWAMIATDRFFVNTPGLGKALVAGYSTTATGWDGGHKVNGRPGYGWYFGRDASWSGFAVIDYGDFEKIKSQLQFFNRFQDLSGKIFHELTTSGVVHYDAADATPLYIILAGKYLRHSGDVQFIRQIWQNIDAAIKYCFSTDTDKDHLIENTNVGHGWVEGGGLYGSHTTLYLASCWAAALDEASYMTSALGLKEKTEFYKSESQIVKNIINNNFWNEENKFFYYGKLKDESYNPEPTVLPAIPLYFKQANKEKAVSVLTKYAGNGFSSDWGVRILSEESPLFNPRGYHYGSVWPLFTGWTALAEFNNERYTQGFTHIMSNLLVYKNWALGFVEEVLNGDEYQPSGVCRHQCWSETMVLQPIIEGLLGLDADALDNKLKLSPHLPADWDTVKVERIRMADHVVDFKMNRKNGKTIFEFTNRNPNPVNIEFAPSFPAGTQFDQVFLDGKSTTIQQNKGKNHSTIDISFYLNKSALLEIHHFGGISVLPHVPTTKPGYQSQGFRIISAVLNGDIYSINVQGISGNNYIMKVYAPANEISTIDNGEIIRRENDIYTIAVGFEENDLKYVNKTIILELRERK